MNTLIVLQKWTDGKLHEEISIHLERCANNTVLQRFLEREGSEYTIRKIAPKFTPFKKHIQKHLDGSPAQRIKLLGKRMADLGKIGLRNADRIDKLIAFLDKFYMFSELKKGELNFHKLYGKPDPTIENWTIGQLDLESVLSKRPKERDS